MSNNKNVLLTHYDLDGVGCNILLSHLYDFTKVIYTGYGKLNKILKSGDLNSYNACFITDISLSIDDIKALVKEYGNRLLYIDHHKTSESTFDYISKCETKPLNIYSDKLSASGIVYQRFNKSLKSNTSKKLSPLIQYIDAYDMWRHKTHPEYFVEGHKLNVLFWHYKYKPFFNRFRDGVVKFNDYEIDILDDYYRSRDSIMNTTEREEFGENSILYIGVENNYINEYPLIYTGYDFYYMLLDTDNGLRLSIRTDLDRVDIGKVLKSMEGDARILTGGGHRQAAGIEFSAGIDFNSVIDVIEIIDNKLINEIIPF